ncbi:hypothetical protein ACLVWQ_16750 [Streptomyces sp. CWNU-52B]|uniref:hypothetical protein n=1 Tax=unclassified Streptomyces TaxID=2593676 RepID=UPI0039C23848
MLNRPSRRRPRRSPRTRRTAPTPVLVLAPALVAAALFTTAGCSGDDTGAAGDAAASASALAARAPSSSPSVTVAPTLTEAQAESALLTPADLGDDWKRTEGTATWRDTLLKGKADVDGCQRLLDGLYAEDLLGEPAGARATTSFDDTDDEAQLRYQVGAYDRSTLDASLTWLKAVPTTCGQFTATDARGGQFTVKTAAAPLPALGEAREGLRVTVSGDSGGWPAVLTLDYAAVRVGDSALSFTHGGLDGIDDKDTRRAAEAGTRHLQDVLAGRTPSASASASKSASASPSVSSSASASVSPSAAASASASASASAEEN